VQGSVTLEVFDAYEREELKMYFNFVVDLFAISTWLRGVHFIGQRFLLLLYTHLLIPKSPSRPSLG